MAKIRLSIVSNGITPYRLHLHSRLCRECGEIELWSVFTHEFSNAPWRLPVDPEIRPVYFGDGETAGQEQLRPRPLHEAWKGLRITRWLKEQRIDVVILFGYNDPCLLLLAWWCRRNHKPCYLFGDSNSDCDIASGIRGVVKRTVLPLVLRLFTAVMHCGTKGAEYYRRYGVRAERLIPFPYEPDYEQIRNAGASAHLGKRRLLYCGRLTAVKRVDLLLAAYSEIAAERPEWDLVIAGDGPMRSELVRQVRPALRDRIQFLGFINEADKVASLYSTCDALVLPSDYEPWGVVVTEAAVRLALVCSSKVGAAADLVEDHANGRIFPAGDVVALRNALLEVTDPARIDAMKSASPRILAEWRRNNDPVIGLRRALETACVAVSPRV